MESGHDPNFYLAGFKKTSETVGALNETSKTTMPDRHMKHAVGFNQ